MEKIVYVKWQAKYRTKVVLESPRPENFQNL